MSGGGRVAVAVGAVVAVVVLFFVFRSGGDEDEVASPPPPPPLATTVPAATGTGATATTETEPPPPPRPPGPVRARLAVVGGDVVGGRRLLKVKQGRQVVLVVRADVSDHVHLHGYDLMADVAPGSPARIRFRATITGRFEIELEDRALPIAELEVRP